MRALRPLTAVAVLLFCCARATAPSGSATVPARATTPLDPELLPSLSHIGAADASFIDGPESSIADDPMALHDESPEALRALMGNAASLPLPVGGGPWRIGQGNRAISRHAVGRRACVEGLHEVVLQTPAQRERCGQKNMVPIWDKGASVDTARFCIDIFEFPNKACELPFVFVAPFQAKRICEAQAKRLCAQEEWNLACRGDPTGGPDRVYAYSDELDLTVCNTNKSRLGTSPLCDVSTNDKVWATCGTHTEPSGAFPGCRSRFGVFDQHGNVAEIMTRLDPADREVKSQLKGSAFFYVDVAEKPNAPGGYWTRYPDHCAFDPRWHVENIETAAHMNYHLGFRCCKSLGPNDAGSRNLRDAPVESTAPDSAM
ncbi:MAG: SUMF1/EgtB/PvdO family nonheme iron enzyme [Myxococcota bacterium]|nr:SUMF1/EgtB/PvdO family nonheme iron enzyme [Myxococcota bacterium]